MEHRAKVVYNDRGEKVNGVNPRNQFTDWKKWIERKEKKENVTLEVQVTREYVRDIP